MTGRGEVTDQAWARIEPLLPPQITAGTPWRDHRQVINGILWKIRTGAPWRDVPARYGPWKTCHERLRVWTFNGLWEKVLAEAQGDAEAVGDIEWTVSIDSTVARAHQHSAGARKKGAAHPLVLPRSKSMVKRSAGPEAD